MNNSEKINKVINNGVKKVNQQDLYTQQVIKGVESFIPESDNNKQTNVSKMSKIGRKLPGIKKNEYFKFNMLNFDFC
ncbi:hypothetical protein [Borrelia crocidurae]|uniref:hypothetical protein n=1 Tax=Borrelia crocidurae TaxID=29520 RepID=UPI00046D09DE|nr:hypothetical protein [Borrelia crocidurae]